MRVAFLAGWLDEKGEMVSCTCIQQWVFCSWSYSNLHCFSLDFNDEIQSREKFADIIKVQKEWERYVGTSFEPAGEPESDAEDSEGDTEPRQRQKLRKAKEDPVKAVTHEDGLIWVEEISGKSRNTLQALVRGFLTAHYRECRHCSLWKCH